MTDTPETDAAYKNHAWDMHDHIPLEFARKLERERDEWQLNALLKLAVKQLACMWCGEIVHAPTGYEPGTPLSEDQRGQAYREHVATCPKHPIREVERERDEIREDLKFKAKLCAELTRQRDEITSAIRNLRDVKGRHHTQQATEALFNLLP
jgi:hypothetical protein